MKGTIFALGGGGFLMSPDGSSLIDDEILRAAQAEKPKVCFVPTAMGDSISGIERFESAFADRADTSVLSLFGQQPWGYRDPKLLLDHHVIYVGGGSTANLLALWRLHGLPEILWEAASRGTILAGISAGANCWFEASSTDSFGPLAPLRDGLGLLEGSFCPHYLGEESRRASFQQWVAEGTLPAGYAADDYCALRFEDGVFIEAIAERQDRPFAVVGSGGEQLGTPRLLLEHPAAGRLANDSRGAAPAQLAELPRPVCSAIRDPCPGVSRTTVEQAAALPRHPEVR